MGLITWIWRWQAVLINPDKRRGEEISDFRFQISDFRFQISDLSVESYFEI
jgi:hypothetical protein